MRKFSTKRILYPELFGQLDAISTRAAVIVATSSLEELTKTVVKYNFVCLSAKVEKSMFGGYGPLSTFSSTIDVAFAMGLVSQKARHDLHAIRAIRNDFAHSVHDIDLSEPQILASLRGLHCAKEMDPGTSPQNLFKDSVDLLMLFLIMRTAPSQLRGDAGIMRILKRLDFSNYYEVPMKDVSIDTENADAEPGDEAFADDEDLKKMMSWLRD